MEFDVLLNKIIEITEKNLQAQSEFVKAIYELKSRLDSDSYSKEDFKHDLNDLSKNINDISNLMNQTSNKEIMTLLQSVKDDRSTMQVSLQNINDTVDHIKKCAGDFEDFTKDHKAVTSSMYEKIKTSNKLYKAVVAILAVITLAVGGIQLIFKIKNNEQTKKIDVLLEKIEKSIK